MLKLNNTEITTADEILKNLVITLSYCCSFYNLIVLNKRLNVQIFVKILRSQMYFSNSVLKIYKMDCASLNLFHQKNIAHRVRSVICFDRFKI